MGLGISEVETHSDEDAADPADEASFKGLLCSNLGAFAASRSNETIVLVDFRKDAFHDVEIGREIRIHEHDVITIGFKEAMLDVMTLAELIFVRKD